MLVFSVCGCGEGFNGLRIVGFHGYDTVYYFMAMVIVGVYVSLWFLLLIFVYG